METASYLGAKGLEALVKEATEWYAETRLWLIEQLESDGYPYGTTPKPEHQQLLEFLNMKPADWAAMFQQFKERYRGLPDAYPRAVADIDAFRQDMEKLHLKINTQPEGVIYG